MHRRFIVCYSAFWICVLAYGSVLVRKNAVAHAKPDVTPGAREPNREEAILRRLADYERQAKGQLNGLTGLEAKQASRAEAAKHTYEARCRLQFAKSAAWSNVLATNKPTFEWLRHQADQSPSQSAQCTICNGSGTFAFCILCDNSGKCPSCKGRGVGNYSEICPTCLGVGKCFLCAGSGRMTCHYCDDGTISRRLPPPPTSLPVRCDPVPAPVTVAAKSKPVELASLSPAEARRMLLGPQLAGPPPVNRLYNGLLLLFALLLGLVLAFRKFAGPRDEGAKAWQFASSAAANFPMGIRAEDKDFAEFITAFPKGTSVRSPKDTTAESASAAVDTVSDFLVRAANLLVAQRKLLEDIVRETDPPARQRILADLRREICTLKGEAGLPEVLLIWQMAAALEGLLKQLTDKVGNVTGSTLRTVAGGVDLLVDLCQPGFKPDLLTAQPLKFLAVDDDPISRKALSVALRKALSQPELAEDGVAALALATSHAYDVIFLDVQMPGMDGFELCTKIHDTVSNPATPVVFVTVQSDFETHANATLSGGCDLMGKPFLSFEVTVKALTLALRGRLQARASTASAGFGAKTAELILPAPEKARCESTGILNVPARSTDSAPSSQLINSGPTLPQPCLGTRPPVAEDLTASRELRPEDFADQFLTRAAAQLAPVRELFQSIFQTAEAADRQEMLAEIYLCIHALDPKTNFTAMHPAIQMSAALQGLLRKLLENPKHATPSTLVTVAAGVDLLQDLCVPGLKADLMTNPPIRMLVVDDDAISRRAVVYALQTAFEKPDAVESGEAALALAAERPFDLIFLDVHMPAMDGFTTCAKLHESALNRATPVVFVTGQDDFNARTQMSRSGGNDFVGKPFLISEITVKALTFTLRGRLEKLEATMT